METHSSEWVFSFVLVQLVYANAAFKKSALCKTIASQY
jgi:hypothetical protein